MIADQCTSGSLIQHQRGRLDRTPLFYPGRDRVEVERAELAAMDLETKRQQEAAWKVAGTKEETASGETGSREIEAPLTLVIEKRKREEMIGSAVGHLRLPKRARLQLKSHDLKSEQDPKMATLKKRAADGGGRVEGVSSGPKQV